MEEEIIDFKQYEERAKKTAIYPNIGKNLIYTVLALAGEAGELANKVKKLMRDHNLKEGDTIYDILDKIQADSPDKETRDAGLKIIDGLPGELGGVLWYTALSSYEIAYPFDLIATHNLRELHAREAEGKVHGSGDDRGLER